MQRLSGIVRALSLVGKASARGRVAEAACGRRRETLSRGATQAPDKAGASRRRAHGPWVPPMRSDAAGLESACTSEREQREQRATTRRKAAPMLGWRGAGRCERRREQSGNRAGTAGTERERRQTHALSLLAFVAARTDAARPGAWSIRGRGGRIATAAKRRTASWPLFCAPEFRGVGGVRPGRAGRRSCAPGTPGRHGSPA